MINYYYLHNNTFNINSYLINNTIISKDFLLSLIIKKLFELKNNNFLRK